MSYDPINSSTATWGIYQIILFMQELFKSQPQGNFLWDCDEAITELMIVSRDEVNYETIDFKPTLALAENNINPENKAIGNLKGYDFKTGETTYFDSYKQTITIQCMAKVTAEARRLADMVFSGLKYNQGYIMERGFNEFVPQAIGDKQVVKGSASTDIVSFTVPVMVAYIVEWTINDKEPVPLGGVGITINLE